MSEQKYKVVAVDNFDRDHISDKLIADNLTLAKANALKRELNSRSGNNDLWYHEVYRQDKPLYVGDF